MVPTPCAFVGRDDFRALSLSYPLRPGHAVSETEPTSQLSLLAAAIDTYQAAALLFPHSRSSTHISQALPTTANGVSTIPSPCAELTSSWGLLPSSFRPSPSGSREASAVLTRSSTSRYAVRREVLSNLTLALANILLGLGFLPGLLHAWYIIISDPEPTYTPVQDAEQGNVTYYYVQTSGPQYSDQTPQGSQRGYGTVNSTPNAQFPSQHQGFVQPPSQPQAPAQAGPSEGDAPPPSYQQATGDNKVQRP